MQIAHCKFAFREILVSFLSFRPAFGPTPWQFPSVMALPFRALIHGLFQFLGIWGRMCCKSSSTCRLVLLDCGVVGRRLFECCTALGDETKKALCCHFFQVEVGQLHRDLERVPALQAQLVQREDELKQLLVAYSEMKAMLQQIEQVCCSRGICLGVGKICLQPCVPNSCAMC